MLKEENPRSPPNKEGEELRPCSLLGTNMFPFKGITFKDDGPFPKEGYVSFLEGKEKLEKKTSENCHFLDSQDKTVGKSKLSIYTPEN